MNKPIYYIGNNSEVIQFLQLSIRHKENLLKLEDISKLEEFNYLLIVSPIKINLGGTFFRWVDISSLWENYLLEHYPHIRLMIVGFWSCNRMSCVHYRDVLDLGNWRESLLSPYFPTLEEVYAKKEIEEGRLSEWDIRRYLKRFADGHERQGFFKYLTALKHTMTVAYDESKMGDYKIIEKEVIKSLGEEEWKHLSERWIFYKPFLEHTPFCQHLEKIEGVLQGMHTYFRSVLKKTPNFAANEALFTASPRKFEEELEKIHRLLKHDLNPYI